MTDLFSYLTPAEDTERLEYDPAAIGRESEINRRVGVIEWTPSSTKSASEEP